MNDTLVSSGHLLHPLAEYYRTDLRNQHDNWFQCNWTNEWLFQTEIQRNTQLNPNEKPEHSEFIWEYGYFLN